MRRFFKYAHILIFLFSCDVPTKSTSNMENIFDLSIDHDIQRITGKGTINLKWDPMSVEDFSHFSKLVSSLVNESVSKLIIKLISNLGNKKLISQASLDKMILPNTGSNNTRSMKGFVIECIIG